MQCITVGLQTLKSWPQAVWPDQLVGLLFNIWPFATMKIYPIAKNCQGTFKHVPNSKKPNKAICRKFLKFGQSGVIWPNLVAKIWPKWRNLAKSGHKNAITSFHPKVYLHNEFEKVLVPYIAGSNMSNWKHIEYLKLRNQMIAAVLQHLCYGKKVSFDVEINCKTLHGCVMNKWETKTGSN